MGLYLGGILDGECDEMWGVYCELRKIFLVLKELI